MNRLFIILKNVITQYLSTHSLFHIIILNIVQNTQIETCAQGE